MVFVAIALSDVNRCGYAPTADTNSTSLPRRMANAVFGRSQRPNPLADSQLPEQRHIYWYFVSSRSERIEQASRTGGTAIRRVADGHKFILLLEEPQLVSYSRGPSP